MSKPYYVDFMELFDKIEAYHNGALTQKEQKIFNKELYSNPAFAHLVKHHKKMRWSADGILELELLDNVQQIVADINSNNDSHTQSSEEHLHKKRNPKYYWLIALTLVIITSAYWLFHSHYKSNEIPDATIETIEPKPNNDQHPKNHSQELINPQKVIDEKEEIPTSIKAVEEEPDSEIKPDHVKPSLSTNPIMAQAFTPYRHPSLKSTTRGQNELSMRDQFEMAYWDANYDQAAVLYQKLSDSEKNNASISFLYGNVLLFQKKYNEAVIIFRELEKNKNRRFDQAEQWYLALALIGDDQRTHSKILLNSIANSPDHTYRANALDLMKKLNL